MNYIFYYLTFIIYYLNNVKKIKINNLIYFLTYIIIFL